MIGSLFDEHISRRSFLKGAGIGALGIGAGGLLAACSSIKGSGGSAAGASSSDDVTLVADFACPDFGDIPPGAVPACVAVARVRPGRHSAITVISATMPAPVIAAATS